MLPPLRLSGVLAYDMRAMRSGGESSSIANVLTATVGTSTYIYAPWLATASATIGLSSSVTTNEGGTVGSAFNDAQVHDRIRLRENFITGEGRLDMFPRSRFPSEVHVSRHDSRTDSGLASPIQFQRQNIGGSVRYRPASGKYDLVGTYDHYDQTGLDFHHRQDSLSADYTTYWKGNEFALGGTYNRARDDAFGDDSRFTSVVARHTYTPSTALSVNSTANATRTEERGRGLSDLQVLQLSTVGIHHPEGSPLTLTGTARALVLRDNPTDSATDAVGATLGAIYEVNPNLRLNANGGVSATQANGFDSSIFNGSVGATYTGDTLEFRQVRYDWFVGGTLGGATGNSNTLDTVTEQNVGLQLGHTLSRNWFLSERSSINVTAGQSLTASRRRNNALENIGRGVQADDTLLNSLSVGWQQNGDGKSGYARATYSDALQLDNGGGRFQMLNFQLSGNFELGYGRSIVADLTYQRSNQREDEFQSIDPISTAGLRTGSSSVAGEVTFRQNQVFGVPRLVFLSRLRLAQDVLKQPGQLLSIPDRETRLWENRLDWTVGRLMTQMELRLSQIDGRRVDSLWLRVQRNFGY